MKKCVCGEEMTPAEWKNQWVCHRCGRTKPMRTTVTNADRIRVMSDEELAEFLWDFNLSDVSTVKMGEFGPHMFRYRLKEWLQQPAEEVDHA